MCYRPSLSGLDDAAPHPGRYIGEESVAAGEKVDFTDAPTWIIDPVDGTMNFVHSFPFTCVSIGKQPKRSYIVCTT